MPGLLHELIFARAERTPSAIALRLRDAEQDYATLAEAVGRFAAACAGRGLEAAGRVAIWLPKRFETVAAIFGACAAGGAFVPVNPLLKPEQVGYILNDCNVRILVTDRERARLLAGTLAGCADLHTLVVLDSRGPEDLPKLAHVESLAWETLLADGERRPVHRRIDTDLVSILYTSGSTGRPKGVCLSHRNMLTGAWSVAQYLGNSADDHLLAVLPFSFDYGLSQLTTAFHVGARVTLMDYLLPRDVVRAVAKHGITGLAAVPPLWVQLAQLDWPAEAVASLRYLTNSGGKMPRATLEALRAKLPETTPFLMYGLTEAFRSTYLPPAELDRRPDSIGKAIPYAEILVVREDGSACAPGEPGELVHRGSLVGLGYWNDPVKTAERYKPAPGQPAGLVNPELAVWSGDTVRMDEDGYLYFIGRRDDMIKTSGYRVSPTEVEEVLYGSGLVAEAAAIGVAHGTLGQAVVAVIQPAADAPADDEALLAHCKRVLPNFMVPLCFVRRAALPRNPNGKIDRKQLAGELETLYAETGA
ncbi:acyl-CoA ligase (AMP-forming), exosortase A system-associated [Plasticicumulans sp.]|uniref:acyl-CoA ligase (AMP-forming), exosortase A system-associated n=1 Tax=Plasticicumulans sp. TaxID=2307179 RepID=UPI002CE746FD|nr:acyl-CoA ligase (AMP-forming), exosortase A system-associated [Plasticicumulans sp.]HMV39553.1 acyl-CoA ligase (AMP-forming), exosortase A system-associated [Plasticicumulans sp.]HNM44458.1 acyl-CoA ligase (AMP-forming), exosortase A system-associated [Plasticicumulans sp.]